MSNIKQDKYILGQSMDMALVNVGQEIRIDLTLEDNTNIGNGEIYGIVKDENNVPIENALVKLMSSSYMPIYHTFTDSNGRYSFDNLPSNVPFNVFSIAKGTKLTQSNLSTIGPSGKIEVNLVLIQDNAMNFSVIVGDIVNSVTLSPINEAIVSLFLNDNGNLILKGMTYTNEYGQYTFREIPKGNYKIEVFALGYNDLKGNVYINKDGDLISFNMSLTKNAITSKGTISGVIVDDNDMPVSDGQVVLYAVSSNDSGNKSIHPIAFTTTNKNGIYLFGNVPKGDYLITANKVEIITIPVESDGTVSGIIVDSLDKPIKNADVILCKVINKDTSNESNIPIAYTTTDDFGAYLFKDVPIGTFLVKATKVTLVSIS